MSVVTKELEWTWNSTLSRQRLHPPYQVNERRLANFPHKI